MECRVTNNDKYYYVGVSGCAFIFIYPWNLTSFNHRSYMNLWAMQLQISGSWNLTKLHTCKNECCSFDMNVVLLTSALLEHLLLGENRGHVFLAVLSTVSLALWKSNICWRSMVKTLGPTSSCDLGGLHVPWLEVISLLLYDVMVFKTERKRGSVWHVVLLTR